MEPLHVLTTLVMDNLEDKKIPAWVAGRLLAALSERDCLLASKRQQELAKEGEQLLKGVSDGVVKCG